ncbi:hypothetical protein SASPL_143166 [Salvia splendens]|uniref:SHSP domain-containing protein n=1 Tax=Salvia splendens TaxID=180675 RepID=A0A8X8WKD4_SALSN|nr:hypothetical protein SASPL_143166 [Salvia splendens]
MLHNILPKEKHHFLVYKYIAHPIPIRHRNKHFERHFAVINSLSSIPNRNTSQFAATRVDWKETPEAHVFKADVPGLRKEEIKVEVEEGNILQISGERSREKEEKNDTWHRVERSSGKFLRRFRLPENAKADQVKASMENGVLTVTVPKKPQVKAIDISG